MPSTDKNVYILGAGFSKELGLPLQDDFLLAAKEVYFKDPKKYKHFEKVFQYQDQLSKMRKFLNYPLWNLEQLFNLVEMDLFYSGNDTVKQIKNDFVNLINDTLLEFTPNPFYHTPDGSLRVNDTIYENYIKFLMLFFSTDTRFKHGIIPNHDTIISFNYDLTVETTACILNWEKDNQIGLQQNPNADYFLKLNVIFEKDNMTIDNIDLLFKRKLSPNYFPPSDIFSNVEPFIKLIKLHGSINWTSKKDNKTFIVPPTWNKSDEEIRKLWELAYNELKEAKRIIIIGYSFPETDIYVKSLLALALNENRKLQGLYFINPDTNVVKNACLSLLDKNFEKYCEYQPWKFSEFISSEKGQEFIRDKLNR